LGAPSPRHITIIGAGIAGLTAALAFARQGFAVRILERAERLEETGAGLQLSPNATRLLDRLGVLERLAPNAICPEAVVLRDARSLRELARVPLGRGAEHRWGAPYIVVHRADLQKALLARVADFAAIELNTGIEIANAPEANGGLIVGADGVWSAVRKLLGRGESRFSGQVAWRATVDAGYKSEDIAQADIVSAFLHPGVHLVCYPVRGGAATNLVAVMKGGRLAEDWTSQPDPAPLYRAMDSAAPPLRELVEQVGRWTAWPVHTVDRKTRWSDRRDVVLIGDAAHAMTPFAAQGAAMAIEDAVVLADLVAVSADLGEALRRYETLRRPRIARVSRRGALNHLAWHASGPVALARNLILRTRPPGKLAADLDWLYGWEPPPARS
jgi:salicylate hydroxylase